MDPELIEGAESVLGVRLPEQYRELVRYFNAPRIRGWQFTPLLDPEDAKHTWDDIVRQNTDPEVRWSHLPRELLAIADNGSGDKLCFRLVDGALEDKVLLWYHDSAVILVEASDLMTFVTMNWLQRILSRALRVIGRLQNS